MGILPIGFFSPLPLAMMIPFMATQSLAMGEAFGKSFQYGKRKISSLSNEEFNKLTFHDLMVEQTANITAIVPELNKQMSQSKTMQEAIFKEMIELIPTFFDSLFSAIKPEQIENQTTSTSQASPPPQILEIRFSDRRSEFNQPAIDELQKQLEKALLEQRGTKESLEEKLNPPPPTPEIIQYTTPPEKLIPSTKVLSAAEDPVYLEYIKALGQTKAVYQKTKAATKNRPYNEWTSTLKNQATNSIQGIANFAKHYRHPNNHIRENALRLRAAIAGGQWKRWWTY